jgi:flagellar assembly protein FliH
MKDLSNKGIISADQLDQWSSWSPGELEPPSSPLTGLTAEQIDALTAAAGLDVAGQGNASLPDSGEDQSLPAQQLGYPTASELETIHQEAWQSGHDAGQVLGLEEGRVQGLEQGRAEGLSEMRLRFESAWVPLSELSRQFSLSVQALEVELSGALLALSVKLAERLVAAHLAVDAHAIEPLLREALAALPATLAQGRLRVNPHDLEVARTFLELERPETIWQWVEDAEVARGGCLLETPSLRKDLTMPSRMRSMMQALGLESSDDE